VGAGAEFLEQFADDAIERVVVGPPTEEGASMPAPQRKVMNRTLQAQAGGWLGRHAGILARRKEGGLLANLASFSGFRGLTASRRLDCPTSVQVAARNSW
jgi:hypothetical protein